MVDDCSRDKTVDIAKAYADRDPRIRVHVNDHNLGDYPNRNRAAGLARGQFLKYLDSDDLMYPHCLEVMHSNLNAEPRATIAMSGSNHWSGGACPMLLCPRQVFQREFLGNGGLFNLAPAAALFRTTVFRELGGFSPQYGVASDYMFWVKACAHVSVLLVPADLYWYRHHPGQEYNSPKAAIQYAALGEPFWNLLFSPDFPLQGLELEQARRNTAWFITRSALRDLRAGRWKCARLQLAGMTLWEWLRYCRRARIDVNAGVPFDANGDFLPPRWLHSDSVKMDETHTIIS